MRLKHRISIGGVQLDSLDNAILISGIDEAAGKDTITASSNALGSGQRITGIRRDTLDLTVRFSLAMKSKNASLMTEREELLEKIIAWAAGAEKSAIQLNYRPGRYLRAVLAQAPGAGDAFKWNSEYTMVFRAYSVPYWTDQTPSSIASKKAASSGTMTLALPGSAPSVADVTVVNQSGAAINSVTVTIGGKAMTFAGTGILPAGGTLTIDHPWSSKMIYLRARVGSKSVLAARTGADDFTVNPGDVAISWSASRAVSVTVSARGRYL